MLSVVRTNTTSTGTEATPVGGRIDMDTKTALRHAAMPLVEDLIYALQKGGMTKSEACKAVRWAAHVVEGRK